MPAERDSGAKEYCAKCRKEITYGGLVPPGRFRVFDPKTAQEIYLRLHPTCTRAFVAGAESVLLSRG